MVVLSYAKITQTRGKKVYFQFPECSFILCKDNANWRKENLFSVFQMLLILTQRYCFTAFNARSELYGTWLRRRYLYCVTTCCVTRFYNV